MPRARPVQTEVDVACVALMPAEPPRACALALGERNCPIRAVRSVSPAVPEKSFCARGKRCWNSQRDATASRSDSKAAVCARAGTATYTIVANATPNDLNTHPALPPLPGEADRSL